MHRLVDTPLGQLTLVGADGVLSGLYFPGHSHPPPPEALGPRVDHCLEDVFAQLREYLAGRRTEFTVSIALRGTEFQLRVWDLLRTIPYGETRTYAELAEQLGNPAAIRALAAANGRNPVSILVPCHRVIGSGGALVGYAGGLERKRLLLELEGAIPAAQTLF